MKKKVYVLLSEKSKLYRLFQFLKNNYTEKSERIYTKILKIEI